MNSGRTTFSQLMDFLPMYEFDKCVDRYNGNYEVRSFSCWDQFLCMAFAQLTYRESLRDIQACLGASRQKLMWFHLNAALVPQSLIQFVRSSPVALMSCFVSALTCSRKMSSTSASQS